MKRLYLTFFMCLLIGKADNAVMTIYKDGYALVKQPVFWTVTPTSGSQTLRYQALPEGLVDDSPFLTLDHGNILGQRYYGKLFSGNAYFARMLGAEVTVGIEDGDEYSGKLLDYHPNSATLQTRRDVITINDIAFISHRNQIKNPRIYPLIEWDVDMGNASFTSGNLAYLSYGFDWDAHYRLVLNDNKHSAEFISEANVTNQSRMDFINATLQLVEGNLGRPSSGSGMRPQRTHSGRAAAFEAAPDLPSEETLGDFHIFRPMKERSDFIRGEKITVRLYEPRSVAFEKTYVFENSERSKKEEPLKVEIAFDNTEDNNLNIPLPQGKVNLYYENGTSLEFAGEDFLRQIPKGETALVKAGRAFDVIGKRTVLNFDRQQKSEEASIEIIIKNTRENDIDVRVVEHIRGDWVVKDASDNFTKKDASTIHFPLNIKAGTKKTLTYTYRKEWK